MRGIAWCVVVMGLAAQGCFETPQEVLDEVTCTQLCRCIPLIDCEDQCLTQLSPVSQECFEFVSARSQDCAAVQSSLGNGGVCVPPTPDPTEEDL